MSKSNGDLFSKSNLLRYYWGDTIHIDVPIPDSFVDYLPPLSIIKEYPSSQRLFDFIKKKEDNDENN